MLRFVSWNSKCLYRRPPACPPALRLGPPPLCELPMLRLGDELLMLRLGALLLILRLGALLLMLRLGELLPMLRLGAEDVLMLLLGRELLLLPKLRLGLELLLPTLLLGRELLLLPEPMLRSGREPLRSKPAPDSILLVPASERLTPDSCLLVPDSCLLTPLSRLSRSTIPPLLWMRPLLSGRPVTRVELWLLPWNSPRSQRSCIPTCSLLGARKCSL